MTARQDFRDPFAPATESDPGMDSAALPLLPAVRPRRLSMADPGSCASMLGHYGLFGRLPLELRLQILAEALGGRTLHIDLSFRHPFQRQKGDASQGRRSRWRSLICLARRQQSKDRPTQTKQQEIEPKLRPGMSGHCGLNYRLVQNKKLPKAWQWFGCVCHRRENFTTVERNAFLGVFSIIGNWIPPGWDRCCEQTLFCMCESWPSSRHAAECVVNAMGWLLTCRQAYADGIDILYSANTLHLSGEALVENLPQLILPQRLASVRSLELLWPLDDKKLRWLCDSIPGMFPRLEELHLSLKGIIRPPRLDGPGAELVASLGSIMAAERMIFEPIGGLLLQLPRKSLSGGLTIAVSRGFWLALLWKLDELKTPGLRAELEWTALDGRFWKRIPEQADGGDLGYWVCSNKDESDDFMIGLDGPFRLWGLWRDDPDPARRGIPSLSCPHTIDYAGWPFKA